MDEHRTDALQYGHLGTAVYLPEVQSWRFSRNPTRRKFFNVAKEEKKGHPLTRIKRLPFVTLARRE